MNKNVASNPQAIAAAIEIIGAETTLRLMSRGYRPVIAWEGPDGLLMDHVQARTCCTGDEASILAGKGPLKSREGHKGDHESREWNGCSVCGAMPRTNACDEEACEPLARVGR